MSNLEMMSLGQTGVKISRLGLGCWAIGGHGWGKVKDEDSIQAIRCALEDGITFFDTADVYGLGKSETMLSQVLGSCRKNVVIASKGGVRWEESGSVWNDISPLYLRQAVENSLNRLKLDCLPLYYIHKPDGVTPIQESIAALERLREVGKIGAIGVSNFNLEQLKQALQVAPISAIQVRLNIFNRDANKDLLELCRRQDITLVAWGALADGLLTGKFKSAPIFSEADHRSRMDEFCGSNFKKYADCLDLLEKMAASRGRSISQLALRWVLDFAPFVCSLFGAKTESQVRENLGAHGWKLIKQNMELIDSITAACRR